MLKLSVLVGFLVAAGLVHAGRKVTSPVHVWRYVDGTVGGGGGSMADTRASPLDVFLGCDIYSYSGYRYGYCEAYDSASYAACGTSDPAMLQIIAAVNVNSYVQFSVDVNGRCTMVYAKSSSINMPVQP